jgi:hypothetical protein
MRPCTEEVYCCFSILAYNVVAILRVNEVGGLSEPEKVCIYRTTSFLHLIRPEDDNYSARRNVVTSAYYEADL